MDVIAQCFGPSTPSSDILPQNKEYYKTWLAHDIDELKAKQKESRTKYYNKNKELKRRNQQESPTTDEDTLSMYMELFKQILNT